MQMDAKKSNTKRLDSSKVPKPIVPKAKAWQKEGKGKGKEAGKAKGKGKRDNKKD